MAVRNAPRPSLVVAMVAAALGLALGPARAWAQAGWYATPSLSFTEEYNDNVFGTSDRRESDFITRFTPGLKLGYRSEPFTLLATGAFDAEIFADNSRLSDPANGKRVGLEFSGIAERPQSFGFNGSWVETQTRAELQPLTGLGPGRARTTQWSLAPWISQPFTERLAARADYSFTRAETANDFTTTTHQSSLALMFQLTPRDATRATYRAEVFQSDTAETVVSHVLTLGWTREVLAGTTVSVDAGARMTEGAVDPEVNASVSHRLELGTASLAYSHTQTNVIGQAGTVEADSVSGSITLEPLRGLTTGIGASYRRSTSRTGPGFAEINVYGADLTVTYAITRWLSARAGYHFYLEEQGAREIPRNLVSVGLDLSDVFRLY